MKRAIHQVALDIIKEHGRAMTAQEVYQIMVDRNLYQFNAKNPGDGRSVATSPPQQK